MSRWRNDAERMLQVRLTHLSGERDALAFERAQLRRELIAEQQLHYGYAKAAKAAKLEQQIRKTHSAWLSAVEEIRQLQEQAKETTA